MSRLKIIYYYEKLHYTNSIILILILDRYSGMIFDKEASKPASNLGPPSVRQRNNIRIAFRWRVDTGPVLRAYRAVISQRKWKRGSMR